MKNRSVNRSIVRRRLTLKALNPDENEISLNMITTCLNIQVTSIKEVITKDEMS